MTVANAAPDQPHCFLNKALFARSQIRVAQARGFSGSPETEGADSGDAESETTAITENDAVEEVALALASLGWPKPEAKKRARRAWRRLSGDRLDDTLEVSVLLKEAARL